MALLIPEPRTDRNGKTVTRWVKPSTQQDAKSFPAPVAEASPFEAYPTVFKEVRKVMDSPDLGVPEEVDWSVIREGLAALPRHTLSYLNSIIENTSDNDYLVRTVISAVHKGFLPASVIDDCAYLYVNIDLKYYSFSTYAGWYKQGGFEGLTVADTTLRGCGNANTEGIDYSYGHDQPMRLQDNDNASKVLAVFNTINAMSKLGWDDASTYDMEGEAEYITDPALAQLVVDYHARNTELLSLIESRKTLDAATLRVILENNVKSLSSGVL